jgi:hypothetical protein
MPTGCSCEGELIGISTSLTEAVSLTGVSGNISKDKEAMNTFLVFVEEGGQVTSLQAWELQRIADALAKTNGAAADVIFKNAHSG